MTEGAEAIAILKKLYNTDIYAANRLLSDFPDEAIEEIEASGQFPNLFTGTLQNDLYAMKLQELSLPEGFLNRFRGRVSNKNLYKILQILTSEEEKLTTELLMRAARNDDPIPFEVIVTLDGVRILKHEFENISMSPGRFDAFPKAPKVMKYLLSLKDSYFNYQVERFLSEANMTIIEELLPLLGPLTDQLKRSLLILARGSSPDTIKYFVNKYNITFNGHLMAIIAHYYHDREFIQWLIQHGSSPVDRVFYNQQFSPWMERQRANPDYLNQ